METIFIDVYDDGPMGARIEYEGEMPKYCPGMGGWKIGESGVHYFTRVKGEVATQILRVFGHGGYGEISMDAGGIIGMDSFK